jgi:orotidine-5'-phosphate decarboxylase
MTYSNDVQNNIALNDMPLIVALDYPDMKLALNMADLLDPKACRVKVGKELYTKVGPKIIEALHLRKFEVFLDLKFHDIPNTTANAVAVAADLDVWMVNVHVSGGRKMMEACVNKLANYSAPPLLIGVTVLTSMAEKDLREVGIYSSPFDHVVELGRLAKASGLDGVVCSAQEAPFLKQQLGKEFKLVTPGIRPSFAEKGDQQRIMTPKDALSAGSDYLVIGRPITQAENPLDALKRVMQEMDAA